MTLLEDTTYTARKIHACDSCGRRIVPGETYHRQRSIYEGEPQTYKAHADCWRASEIVGKEMVIDGDPLPNVIDMDVEERAVVAATDPQLASRLWPAK